MFGLPKNVYLYVGSFTGDLLHLIHFPVSGSSLSTQYPVMGLPPSSSGSFQVNVTASLQMSEDARRVGGPGGSAKKNQYNYCEILTSTKSLVTGQYNIKY